MFIDDGKPIDRIPSGTEPQQKYAQIAVLDAELVSAAERDWLSGDWAAVERAARDATDGIRPLKNGDGEA